MLALALLISGCASQGPVTPRVAGQTAPIATTTTPATTPVAQQEPWRQLWQLPAEAQAIQASYQFQYGGPDGGATPKIILRLQTPSRFSIAASEFGKRIFTLEVIDERALFLDHRAKSHCWLDGQIQLSALPLGFLSLRALPALLFDRLPVEAVGAIESSDEGVRFSDSLGRRWRVTIDRSLEGSGLGTSDWTVLDGDRPEVWLIRRGSTRFLSARDLQLRWKKGHSEALSQVLSDPTPPARYTADCRDFDREP